MHSNFKPNKSLTTTEYCDFFSAVKAAIAAMVLLCTSETVLVVALDWDVVDDRGVVCRRVNC